jgi:hypothetical protein
VRASEENVCARHPELAAPQAFVRYLFVPILPDMFQVGCTQPVPCPDLGNCSRKALFFGGRMIFLVFAIAKEEKADLLAQAVRTKMFLLFDEDSLKQEILGLFIHKILIHLSKPNYSSNIPIILTSEPQCSGGIIPGKRALFMRYSLHKYSYLDIIPYTRLLHYA